MNATWTPETYSELIETGLDREFAGIPSLRWLPWVGRKFGTDNVSRLLIVGESHYMRQGPEFTEERRHREEQNQSFTREIVWECPICEDWPNPTLQKIARIVLGTSQYDPFEFWQHVAFYNFVQRFMLYTDPPERPNGDDVMLGWQVFTRLISLIKPDHCLFLGSMACHSFAYAMSKENINCSPSQRTERLGRCWAYRGELLLPGKTLPIVFTQHPGKYFSPELWHNYLVREIPDVIGGIKTCLLKPEVANS
jgi:hypothetical protein